MNTENEQEKDSTELAKDAIGYVLRRVSEDENIRYHMGAFTESFERLKAAHSALNGISPESIEKDVFGKILRRKSAAEIIDDIKELVENFDNGYDNKAEFIAQIRGCLS